MNLNEYSAIFRNHARKELRKSVEEIALAEKAKGKIFYLNKWIDPNNLEEEIDKRKARQKHMIIDLSIFYLFMFVVLCTFIKFGSMILTKSFI